jgi:outer membrane protein OmpA-like peptidoglycan-associated protein
MSKVPCVDDLTYVNYDARRATLQLQAGVTYHFGNTNGTHHFTKCDKVATQAEIDEMNNKINDLRKQMQDDHNYYHDVIRQLNDANYRLSKELQDCNNRPEKVVEVVNMPPVQFMINSAKIQEASQSALKYMADEILKQDASYIVIGYASEEGETDYNKRLSLKRAEAIRDVLVEYGVPADRLIVEGFGETTEFSEEVPALNRVVVIKQHN